MTTTEEFGSPREIVDWLHARLGNQRPSKKAADVLGKLAEDHNLPELGKHLDYTATRAHYHP